ncbi:MarR family transcriptional regulator [Olivibacter sp. SDN3]|uniref:MarR family winged helix-turn-helix transcriptional regulator n=1 Tax=Olivibacter sp. SDN3 TaxID=2764720 RepID=UPI0016515777|nr:MarR family transcriptional regulator [Olivibacter sp. SDN3]QNL48207.1 MarR family transcriptional regulator [Olivibacter sp. SDN3]
MKPIVELITEWDTYASAHSEVNVEEFCKYYLAKKEALEKRNLFAGMLPPDTDSVLAKLLGRIAAIYGTYSKMALRDKLELDAFYFLNSIYHRRESQKKDIIQFHFVEQSTGMDILRRLLLAGYIKEREDPADKRAKLVSITTKGEKLLLEVYQLLLKPTLLMFRPIPDSEKQLLIDMLSPLEVKHGEILAKNRNKRLDDILLQEVGEQEIHKAYSDFSEQIKEFVKHKSPSK